jgi:hypothetical protein
MDRVVFQVWLARVLGGCAGRVAQVVAFLSATGVIAVFSQEGWDSRTRKIVLVSSLVPFALAMVFLLAGSIRDRIKHWNEPAVTLKLGDKKESDLRPRPAKSPPC